MKLNSEGLEGLISRTKLLLTIRGTFFFGFWALIFITFAFFSALYFLYQVDINRGLSKDSTLLWGALLGNFSIDFDDASLLQVRVIVIAVVVPGEEPPESLFMKELRRRGITPTSLLEDTSTSEYRLDDETSRKEGRAFSQRNAVSTKVEKSFSDQRERSMKLNSEGLEGLIPRTKLLLTIGGTFFFGLWPLILITVAFFSALYFASSLS